MPGFLLLAPFVNILLGSLKIDQSLTAPTTSNCRSSAATTPISLVLVGCRVILLVLRHLGSLPLGCLLVVEHMKPLVVAIGDKGDDDNAA